jgi:hypothetical protein
VLIFRKHPHARVWTDYREMLEKQMGIDEKQMFILPTTDLESLDANYRPQGYHEDQP